MNSPKGKYRMWHTGLIAFVFMLIASWRSMVSQHVWFWGTLNKIAYSLAVENEVRYVV